MNKTYKSVLIFAAVLVVLSGLFFLLMQVMGRVNPDLDIKVETIATRYTNMDLPLDPTDNFWQTLETARVHLFPQAARVPFGNEERDVSIKGAFNNREIAFLLDFEDETENWDVRLHSDACAVMIIPDDSPATAQMMGHRSRANIWHWTANRDFQQHQRGVDTVRAVRELIATGPGTQSAFDLQNVEGKGVYRNGHWNVVIKRPLINQESGEMEFNSKNDFKIAFAVWDGAMEESLGIKSISIVRSLKMLEN
jgi:DMSO reductase family type II enzyme heme b subunit